jgi:hypothetical protein
MRFPHVGQFIVRFLTSKDKFYIPKNNKLLVNNSYNSNLRLEI